jgi:hypothetical protein
MRTEKQRKTEDQLNSWNILSCENSLHAVVLCIVRGIVEKHGGSLTIDPEKNEAYVGIPHSRKAACFQELNLVLDETPCKLALLE